MQLAQVVLQGNHLGPNTLDTHGLRKCASLDPKRCKTPQTAWGLPKVVPFLGVPVKGILFYWKYKRGTPISGNAHIQATRASVTDRIGGLRTYGNPNMNPQIVGFPYNKDPNKVP